MPGFSRYVGPPSSIRNTTDRRSRHRLQGEQQHFGVPFIPDGLRDDDLKTRDELHNHCSGGCQMPQCRVLAALIDFISQHPTVAVKLINHISSMNSGTKCSHSKMDTERPPEKGNFRSPLYQQTSENGIVRPPQSNIDHANSVESIQKLIQQLNLGIGQSVLQSKPITETSQNTYFECDSVQGSQPTQASENEKHSHSIGRASSDGYTHDDDDEKNNGDGDDENNNQKDLQSSPNSKTCPWVNCNQSFPDNSRLREHLNRTHLKGLQCPYCSHNAGDHGQIRRHLERDDHGGMRPDPVPQEPGIPQTQSQIRHIQQVVLFQRGYFDTPYMPIICRAESPEDMLRYENLRPAVTEARNSWNELTGPNIREIVRRIHRCFAISERDAEVVAMLLVLLRNNNDTAETAGGDNGDWCKYILRCTLEYIHQDTSLPELLSWNHNDFSDMIRNQQTPGGFIPHDSGYGSSGSQSNIGTAQEPPIGLPGPHLQQVSVYHSNPLVYQSSYQQLHQPLGPLLEQPVGPQYDQLFNPTFDQQFDPEFDQLLDQPVNPQFGQQLDPLFGLPLDDLPK